MARTLENWKDVAQTLGEIIASHPDKSLGVIGLSYHHLPNHLKPSFLSMGGFPEDFQVEARRLIQLWLAEGFIRTSGSCKSLEKVAEDYLEDLISMNLIMVTKKRYNGEIKACGVHDLVREFCLIEAEQTMFMHVERTHNRLRTLPTQKHNVRRFSFQIRTRSVDDYCNLLPPLARSIYSFGRSNPSFTLRGLSSDVFSRFNLLRVLSIFYDDSFCPFPPVITKLFHLRYIQVNCAGSLPASISELKNLQTLINENCFIRAFLPGEIWMMKNLRRINYKGRFHLPSPYIIGNKYLVNRIPNLEELCGLDPTSCTNEVFSGIPNLKKLIVRRQYSGAPNRLIDMSSLKKLETFKYTGSSNSAPTNMKSLVFPTSLKRLTLARLYFSWDVISTLVLLPNLEELKLKDNAVCGEVWRLSDEDKFQSLKLLLFNKLDFELWEATSDSFPKLERLILKNCSRLKEIPADFWEVCTLESIELHNCGIPAEDCVRKIEQEHEEMGYNSLKVYIL